MACGNLVVVIVAEARIVENQVYEYILFAGLLAIATLAFIIISYFYKYTDDIDSRATKKNAEEFEKKNLSTSSLSKKSLQYHQNNDNNYPFEKSKGFFKFDLFNRSSVQDVPKLVRVSSLY